MSAATGSPITWTLSGFGDEIDADPEKQFAVLEALGARHIEVRSAWGRNVTTFDDDLTTAFETALKAHDFTVSAIASPIGKVDVSLPVEHELDRLRGLIALAHRYKTPYIRIFSFFRAAEQTHENIRDDVLTRMRALASLAETEGIVLLHENEKGIFGDTPDRVLDVIESVGSDALKVAWDSANFVQVGSRPFTDGYAKLRPYLEYLQVKDAVAETGEVVPAGSGDGEVLETLTALRDDGYTGFASLEPHLADASKLGGFSGPAAFGLAARALGNLTRQIGVELV